jgi:hypothetical protein
MNIADLKDLVDRAMADGKLTRQELEAIKLAISLDRKISSEEFQLARRIQEKVAKNEITIVEE